MFFKIYYYIFIYLLIYLLFVGSTIVTLRLENALSAKVFDGPAEDNRTH